MMSLIRRAFGFWFRHEKNCIKRRPKAFDGFYIPYKMRDDNTNHHPSFGDRSHLGCLKGDLPNSVQKFRVGGALEIDEWRRHIGFVGHDGIPWLYDDDDEDWLPVTKSRRYAFAYAALQKQI
jgi:hypothetical protein